MLFLIYTFRVNTRRIIRAQNYITKRINHVVVVTTEFVSLETIFCDCCNLSNNFETTARLRKYLIT